MGIKRIVFFCITPLTRRDFQRFGGDILKENGFDVWFYDFSPIIYPKLYANCAFPDLYRPPNYLLCSNKEESLKAVSELSPDSLVITLLWFNSDTHIIFKALSKTKIPYCALATSSFPVERTQEIPRLFNYIKKVFPLNVSTIKKFLYRPQFAHLWGIRSPRFCMVAGELSLERHKTLYLIDEDTEILWAHALDYDIYLEHSAKGEIETGHYGVFLDPLGPLFQGDALAMDYKVPTTVENYYPSICRFFDQIESQFDTKIEIAAHPKSNHPPYPDYYGGRRTLRGDTFGMLKNSRFVLAHSSNAIQFAILLRKPVVFLTTRELESDTVFSSLITAFAHSIGKTPINIDEPLDIDWEKELYVDENLYDDYINRHIKKRGSEELNTWQILANRLKQL